ncbi:MAG: Ig-like domain-containing protein [Treponema sp.]|nr:Ig-like domain-containing protein [Treponema sp.]
MKKILWLGAALLVAMSLTFYLTSCDEGGGGDDDERKKPDVVDPVDPEITLNSSTLRIMKGNKATLIATVTVPEDMDSEVEWKSSNATIASVSEDGEVEGLKIGTATITVSLAADETVSATCAVTVTSIGLALDKSSIDILLGKTFDLHLTVTKPEGMTEEVEVKWESGDKNTATVDEDGKVTGVKAGTTAISVFVVGYEDEAITCTVNVQYAVDFVSEAGSSTYEIVLGVGSNDSGATYQQFFDISNFLDREFKKGDRWRLEAVFTTDKAITNPLKIGFLTSTGAGDDDEDWSWWWKGLSFKDVDKNSDMDVLAASLAVDTPCQETITFSIIESAPWLEGDDEPNGLFIQTAATAPAGSMILTFTKFVLIRVSPLK